MLEDHMHILYKTLGKWKYEEKILIPLKYNSSIRTTILHCPILEKLSFFNKIQETNRIIEIDFKRKKPRNGELMIKLL